jgi:hypothetical protein
MVRACRPFSVSEGTINARAEPCIQEYTLKFFVAASLLAACVLTFITVATGSAAITPEHTSGRDTISVDLPIYTSTRGVAEMRAWAQASGQAYLNRAPLSAWEMALFGRFLAIDGLTGKYASEFGTDVMWMLQIFAAESVLDPLNQGLETGDRGLGQLGFNAESVARSLIADPQSGFYRPGLQLSANVWNPDSNIALSTVWIRRLYAMPDIRSHQTAYARYTHGDSGVVDGAVSTIATVRVARAESFETLFLTFYALKYAGSNSSMVTGSPQVQAMLALDAAHPDGSAFDTALQAWYLSDARAGSAATWRVVTNLSEQLRYIELGTQVYGIAGHLSAGAVRDLLQGARGQVRASGDADLLRFMDETITRAQMLSISAPSASPVVGPVAPPVAGPVVGPVTGPIAGPVPGSAAGSAAASGKFSTAPAYGTHGHASVVFEGGSVIALRDATIGAGAWGVWVQDAGGRFTLLLVGGPTFLADRFNARFPSGFPGAVAVMLVR